LIFRECPGYYRETDDLGIFVVVVKIDCSPLRQMVKHHITSNKVIRADKYRKRNYSDFIRTVGLFCLDNDKSVLDHFHILLCLFLTNMKSTMSDG